MDNNEFNNELNNKDDKTWKIARPLSKRVELGNVLLVCLTICLVLSLGLLLLVKSGFVRIGNIGNVTDPTTQRFNEVYAYLNAFYDGEIDTEKMTDEALKAYVTALGDPYTQYMEKAEVETFIDGNYGEKAGIGVQIFESNEPQGIYIRYVFPGSPAEKAGVKANDIILTVNNTVVTHENYLQAIDMVSGKEGTTVTLTIQRGNEVEVIPVVRGNYTVSPIEYRFLDGEDGIAYIRINGVSSSSAKQFKTAVKALKDKGAKAYIFDVRDDGGGYLNEVTDMLDLLLPEGPIVRYTHKGEEKERVINSDAEMLIDAPMAVLINENTASAAELFAAALKDYKKATLIGNTTFGKGVIQTLYKLGNGDYIKITTGKYDPPYSENYNGIGVKPDTVVSLPDGLPYHQFSEKDDAQLQAAVKLLTQ